MSARYHFILTVTWQRPGRSPGLISSTGVVEPAPGDTRSSLYATKYRDLAGKVALLAGPEVTPCPVFFSLEPAELLERVTQMRDCPLTCEYCNNAPATHLLTADLSVGRSHSLVCEPCGSDGIKDARKIARTEPCAWLFALMPAGSE